MYEAHCGVDPKYSLGSEDMALELNEYNKLMAHLHNPERVLLSILMDTKHPSSGDQ
ncbi:hypothetical protein IDM30_05950 [Acinetobacter seifertii]|nr:hypothetical protein [Acinetobacter seifertii]